MLRILQHRPQFSLRALFGMVVLFSICFALIAAFGRLAVLGIWLVVGIWLLASGVYCRRRGRTALGALLLVALGVLFVPLFTVALWVGHSDQLMQISVVDAKTTRPIVGAQVTIFEAEGGPILSIGQTDHHGVAVLSTQFMATGSSGFLEKSGRIRVFGTVVSAEAPGYDREEHWLHLSVGENPDLYGGPLPPVTIKLQRTP